MSPSWIGAAAAVLTVTSFLPQAWKIVRTRDANGLSTTMWILETVGFATWIAYGIALRKLPLIVPNVICFVLAGFILAMRIRCRTAGRRSR